MVAGLLHLPGHLGQSYGPLSTIYACPVGLYTVGISGHHELRCVSAHGGGTIACGLELWTPGSIVQVGYHFCIPNLK